MDGDGYLAGSQFYEAESPIESLEERIEELEGRHQSSRSAGVSAAYALGISIAVVLSWSRNASILWRIPHGILGWIYVIYFAFTR